MSLKQKIHKITIFIITNFIAAFRPLFGSSGCCKFEVSCTQYANQSLSKHSLHKACWLIIKRIISCR